MAQSPKEVLARVLKIDQPTAALLVAGGIESLEAVAYAPVEEFSTIDLAATVVEELRRRARIHLLTEAIRDNEPPDQEALDA